MNFNQIDTKKQYILLVVIVLMLLGLYGHYRLSPAINDVGKLNSQLKKDKKLLSNPNIPEEPFEEVDDLEEEVAELDFEMEQLDSQSQSLKKKLPEAGNKDVMLKVSELARRSRVRIVSNIPFLTRKRYKFGAPAINKKLSAKEQRKQEKLRRKAIKRAKRKAARSGKVSAIGVETREGELMDKLVNDFEVSRPLHKLKVEGTYNGVKAFIEAIQGLPWQVTVVKIDYKLLGANAAQGYPQPLLIDMIIGA